MCLNGFSDSCNQNQRERGKLEIKKKICIYETNCRVAERGAVGKGKDAAHTSYDRPKDGKSFSEQRRKVANITQDYGNPKTNRFHMQMRVGTIETE